MALDPHIIQDFVQMQKADPPKPDSIVNGVIGVRGEGDDKQFYVKIDGSEIETPISNLTNYSAGDKVQVMIKNHTAIINGNFTAPSVTDEQLIVAEHIIAEQIDAERIRVDELYADVINAETGEFKFLLVDAANIKEAAIQKLYAETGIVRDLTVGDNMQVTGTIAGLKILGDLIEANTILADKIIFRGEDGLFYKLNKDGRALSAEDLEAIDSGEKTASDFDLTEEELRELRTDAERYGLDGKVILADSITASKISVKDLVAFNATIGGFEIMEDSIHTIGKTAVNSPMSGIYMNNSGEFTVGDENSYVRYMKLGDGIYTFDIVGASSIKTKNKQYTFDDDGLTIRGTGDVATKLDERGLNISKKDNTLLDVTPNGVVARDLHANTYLTIADRCRFEKLAENRVGCFWIGG